MAFDDTEGVLLGRTPIDVVLNHRSRVDGLSQWRGKLCQKPAAPSRVTSVARVDPVPSRTSRAWNAWKTYQNSLPAMRDYLELCISYSSCL